METIKSETNCPTCGCKVEIGTGDDNSHYYIPVPIYKLEPERVYITPENERVYVYVNEKWTCFNNTEHLINDLDNSKEVEVLDIEEDLIHKWYESDCLLFSDYCKKNGYKIINTKK